LVSPLWFKTLGAVSVGDSLRELLEKRLGVVNDALDSDGSADVDAPHQQLREMRRDFPAPGTDFLGLYSVDGGVVTSVTLSFLGESKQVLACLEDFFAELLRLYGKRYTIYEVRTKERQAKHANLALRWEREGVVIIATFPPYADVSVNSPQAFVVGKMTVEHEGRSALLKPVEDRERLVARIQSLELKAQWGQSSWEEQP
jgi:hypothetical protein